jgi:N-ethylmaleimide reductase
LTTLEALALAALASSSCLGCAAGFAVGVGPRVDTEGVVGIELGLRGDFGMGVETQAIVGEIGAVRTGLRLSPVTPSNGAAQDSDPQALHEHVVEQLAPLRLAFLHVIQGQTGGARDSAPFDYAALRSRFKTGHAGGAWMVNNGYDRAMALEAVASGAADLVAFGRPFIGNPDLVRRLRANLPFAPLDRDTLYGGGPAGYTDYPALDEAAVV